MSCKTIACYLPADDEVDPTAIIERAWRATKRVFAPVIDIRGNMIFRELTPDTELNRNYFGLWEPVSGKPISAKAIDLVIALLAAFDDQCHRIGMGGGYFDRTFSFLKGRKLWRHPKLIGAAFDCQRVSSIAPNPWDIGLFRVVTEAS